MRKWLYTVAVVLTVPMLLNSCDEKTWDERYEEMEQITPVRNVLLEEYTGQMCPNCPKAHVAVEQYRKQYGTHFIAVSIHAGEFGVENAAAPQVALVRPEGKIYAQKYVGTYPFAVINRNTSPLSVDEWNRPLRQSLVKVTPLEMEASATLDDSSDKIQIKVDMNSTEDLSGKLQVWITESNIVAPQQNGTEFLAEYTHNHVFQASVNGTWGEKVRLIADSISQRKYEIQKEDYWKKENLAIVAFVYNDSIYNDSVYYDLNEVIQVIECSVK